MRRLMAAVAAVLILALAGDMALPAPSAADPGETGTQNCNQCPVPTCGNACFWPECVRCSRCCTVVGDTTVCRDCSPCRSWEWHTRGYNRCRGGTVDIGDFRMTNYGQALDRAGNPIDEHSLCRNYNSPEVSVAPTATAIPAGQEHLYLTPTPVREAPARLSGHNTPGPVSFATVRAPVTPIVGRTPVPTAADPTARARFGQQRGRGFGPAPTRQSGGADASRVAVADGFPLDVSTVRGSRTGSVLQYRLWRYGGYAPPVYLVPFADVTNDRVYAPSVADDTGWWAVQFRWRHPPAGGATEPTFGGLSEARVFWVWDDEETQTNLVEGAGRGGLSRIATPTAEPAPVLAEGDRLVGNLERYTLNGASKQNVRGGVSSFDSAMLHLTGGTPMDGSIEYRVWPFSGSGPGPDYDIWLPLGLSAGSSRYVEIEGLNLYIGQPRGYGGGARSFPVRARWWDRPLIWSFQVRRTATVIRADGSRKQVYGPASNVVSLWLPYRTPTPTATLFPAGS